MAKGWLIAGAMAAAGLVAGADGRAGELPALDGGPRALSAWRDPETGIAIGGYDPVAYFVAHAPRRGRGANEITVEGVAWRFESAANLAVFERDPKVYAPRFGGRDPMQLARGFSVTGNPLHWVIEEGDLYLFVSARTRFEWLAAGAAERAKAEENWPGVVAATF